MHLCQQVEASNFEDLPLHHTFKSQNSDDPKHADLKTLHRLSNPVVSNVQQTESLDQVNRNIPLKIESGPAGRQEFLRRLAKTCATHQKRTIKDLNTASKAKHEAKARDEVK